jgi:uncharacterized lipoprotein
VLKPAAEVAQTAGEVVQKQHYRISAYGVSDKGFDTEWNVQMSPHWREGNRTKIEVQVVPAEPRGVTVRVRSIREVNDEAHYPMSPEKAKWRGASIDQKQIPKISEPAMRLHQILKNRFFGISNG